MGAFPPKFPAYPDFPDGDAANPEEAARGGWEEHPTKAPPVKAPPLQQTAAANGFPNGAAAKHEAEIQRLIEKLRPRAPRPPRLPTRVIDTPPPRKPEPDLPQEAMKVSPGPQPPRRPPRPKEAGGHQSRPGGPIVEEERYPLISTKSMPAWGPCDPAAIFEARSVLEQVKADVPKHVCLDQYKQADNELIQLQMEFDNGLAKCANEAYVSSARAKAGAFTRCIAGEVRAAPHIREDSRMDLTHKLRAAERILPRKLEPPSQNVPKTPAPLGSEEEVGSPFKKGNGGTFKEGEFEINKKTPDRHIPAEVQKLRTRTVTKPQIVKEPEMEDEAHSPWTEPGAPRSLVNSQMPIAVAALHPGNPPCASAVRKRNSRAFLCEVRAELLTGPVV